MFGLENYKRQKVEQERKTKLLELIDKYEIIDWKESYYRKVMDGTSWKLIIEDIYGNRIQKRGSNDYPENFNSFRNELSELFSEEYKLYNEGIIEFLENNKKLKYLAAKIYHLGLGIRNKNIRKAIELYEETENFKSLADIYYSGNDVDKNLIKAFELYNKEAKIQDTYNNDIFKDILIDYNVYYKIGYMYYKEKEIGLNIENAIIYFEKAIPHVEEAYQRLIEIYFEKKDYIQVVKYFIEMNSRNKNLFDFDISYSIDSDETGEKLYNIVEKKSDIVIKNLEKLGCDILSFEEIQKNIIDIVIKENMKEIYIDLLRMLIYHNLSTEENERKNIKICKSYIDNKDNILETIHNTFFREHSTYKIYSKLASYIPRERINSLLNEMGTIIDNYLKNKNVTSFVNITSDKEVSEFASNVINIGIEKNKERKFDKVLAFF